MRTWEKDPSAVLDWTFDWSDWLAVGETIDGTPTFTITPATTLTKDAQNNSGTAVTVWLSSGTLGVTYKVACKIVTTQARTDERTIGIRVTDR